MDLTELLVKIAEMSGIVGGIFYAIEKIIKGILPPPGGPSVKPSAG